VRLHGLTSFYDREYIFLVIAEAWQPGARGHVVLFILEQYPAAAFQVDVDHTELLILANAQYDHRISRCRFRSIWNSGFVFYGIDLHVLQHFNRNRQARVVRVQGSAFVLCDAAGYARRRQDERE
jgi:hypothetical protein